MNNPIIIGSKVRMKRSALEEVNAKLEAAKLREEEILKAIDDVESEEDLAPIELEVEEIQNELTEKQKEKTELEKEIEELEALLEAVNEKAPENNEKGKGDGRSMVDIKEVRKGIEGYVRSKGSSREGFTTVEGGALIPEELLPLEKRDEGEVNLTDLVRVIPVKRGSGKMPIRKKSKGKFIETAELAANPELATPNFPEVSYDIKTYRGYIPVSQEMIDDSDYDISELIMEDIEDQDANTKNDQIVSAMKTAKPREVVGLDGIITLLNTGLRKAYKSGAKLVVSSSLYNALDLLKDKNGRYLLQDDITVASGKSVKGKEVITLDDDVIGLAEGDLVGFVGDLKSFMTLFDRKQATVKWVDHDIYGEKLAGFVRFEVKVTDEDAGFFITYTPEVAEVAGA